MRRLLLAAAALVLFGCTSEVVDHYPRPDTAADAADATDATDVGEDIVADVAPDAGEEGWAGLPCETDDDCGGAPRQCVTRQLLDNFGVGPEIDVPGGMCSRLLCTSDDDCGPGGMCFDASFLGAPIQICLAQCGDIADCRWQEGWDCMPLTTVVEDATPEDGGACVSDSIQVAIVCDDGHCDEGSGESEGAE